VLPPKFVRHVRSSGPATALVASDETKAFRHPTTLAGVAAQVPQIARLNLDTHLDVLQYAVPQDYHVQSPPFYVQMVATGD